MQPDLGIHCLLERLLKHFSRRQKQTTFVVMAILGLIPIFFLSLNKYSTLYAKKYVFIHTVQLSSGSISINFWLEHLSIPLSMPVSRDYIMLNPTKNEN